MNEQVKQFIETNRAKGVPDNAIVSFLKDKGVLTQEGRIASRGVGFEQPEARQFTGEENVLEATGKTLRNVPRSGFEFGKNIATAVTKPRQTIGAIAGITRGINEKIDERTPESLDKVFDFVKKAMLPGGEFTEKAVEKVIPRTGQEQEQVEQIADFFKNRYGSVDAFKETVVEDPVGVIADIAGVLTLGGGMAVKGGQLSKVSQVSKFGQTAQRTGRAIEPLSIAGKGVQTVGKYIPDMTTVKNVARDVVPTLDDVSQKSLVKGLDLTQGDVKSFKKRTGKNPGEYILQKKINIDGNEVELLGKTPEETLSNIERLKSNSYSSLREQLSKSTRVYNATDVPRVKDTLQDIQASLEGVTGLEDELAEVQGLASKDTYTLSDVQRAKEIFDERYSIYKKAGEVRSGDIAKGLDNVRKDIRKFIEDEAMDELGLDVAGLNDDVSVSYQLEQAIDKASTRDLTRNQIGLSDHIIGTGLGIGVMGGGIDMTTAVGLYVAKKTLESPAFRIAVSRAIKSIPESRAGQILKQIKDNTLTDANRQIIRDVVTEAQDRAVLINPTLDVLTESTE